MNKKMLSLFAGLLATSFAYSQGTFEGTFSLHSESSKKEKAPVDENFTVKNEKVLVEVNNPQTPDKKSKILVNLAEKNTTILVDDNGRKMAMKMRQAPNRPGQQGIPGQPPQPGQAVQPMQPGQPGQPLQPGQPGQPTQLGQQGDQPVQSQPGQPAGQPPQPGQANQAGQPGQPPMPHQPGRPGQPGMMDPHNQETITETKETKKIEGYTCKKYIVKTETSTTDAWVTTEIPVDFAEISSSLGSAMRQPHPGAGNPNQAPKQPKYPKTLKGFPLELTVTNIKTGETTTTTFKDIKKAPVEDSNFDITGYRVMEMPMMPPPPPGAPDEDR